MVLAELRAGALATRAPADVPGFGGRLLGALPLVREGGEGGTQSSALPESWGDALVRTALALQRMAGAPAAFGRVVEDAPAAGSAPPNGGCARR